MLSGGEQAAFFRDGNEIPQMPKFHRALLLYFQSIAGTYKVFVAV
jgi:hypothetical protein